jgi:hypothetical protein
MTKNHPLRSQPCRPARWLPLLGTIATLVACGHANFDHDVEIHLENVPEHLSPDDLVVHFDVIYMNRSRDDGQVRARDGIHVPDVDGVVRFSYRHGTTAVLGQSGPGSLGFNLYIPALTEEGWYRMRLRRTLGSRIREVEGRLVPFGPWPEGADRSSAPLPVRSRLVPRRSTRDGRYSGYAVTVWIDVAELRTEP